MSFKNDLKNAKRQIKALDYWPTAEQKTAYLKKNTPWSDQRIARIVKEWDSDIALKAES